MVAVTVSCKRNFDQPAEQIQLHRLCSSTEKLIVLLLFP